MNVNTVVSYLSAVMRDQEIGNEFTVWEESLVVDAVHEALAAVAHVTPQSFMVSGTHTVTPGESQQLPVDRREMFAVEAQVCGTAPFIHRHTSFSQAAPDSLKEGSACGPCEGRDPFGCTTQDPCGSWKLKRWSWNPARPFEFTLSPPPPNDGVQRVLEVSYLGPIHTDGESPLTDKWRPAVVAYALHRLYSVDVESPSHQQKSKDNFDFYSRLVGGNTTPQQ